MKNLFNLIDQASCVLFATIAFMLSSCGDSVKPFNPVLGESDFVLFINEINAGGNPVDWIEIYNPGTETVSLEGFYLFDDHTDKYQIPPGLVVPAGGHILFYADEMATGEHTHFRLSSGGELIALEDPDENVVDFVEFPMIRGGQSYGRFPDASSNLFITGIQTPEAVNGNDPGPALQRLNRDVIVPTMDDAVIVSVEGFHQKGQISDIQLFYSVNDEDFDAVAMTRSGDTLYTATIPPTLTDAIVNYYVSATDLNGLQAVRPAGAPDSLDTYVISSTPLPDLLINEFLAVNDKCCADNDGETEEFDDWVEIYNPGTEAIDIGGFHLSDDPLDPFKHQIPDNQPGLTTIQAGGYLLIWADGDVDQGPLHAGIRLSSQGETIGLYYTDGRTIDEYEFGIQESDVSMGRSPDGSANWVKLSDPTPAASNLLN